VETALTFDFGKISLTDQSVSKTGTVGTPQTAGWDLTQNKVVAAATASDMASSAQANNMAMSLASFMASTNIGSSGSQNVASASLSQQDNLLPTLAAHS
jgi:hypothetical protein